MKKLIPILYVFCVLLWIASSADPILPPRQAGNKTGAKMKRTNSVVIAPKEIVTRITLTWGDAPTAATYILGVRTNDEFDLDFAAWTFAAPMQSFSMSFTNAPKQRTQRWFFMLQIWNTNNDCQLLSAHWPPFAKTLTGFHLDWSSMNAISLQSSLDTFAWRPETNILGDHLDVPFEPSGKFFRAFDGTNSVRMTINSIWIPDPRDL